MREQVQILSQTTEGRERRFQLSPVPSEDWWVAFADDLRNRLREVGRIPTTVDVIPAPPDEVVATGISEDCSLELDRVLSEIVTRVNRQFNPGP